MKVDALAVDAAAAPQSGQLVRLRTRCYLVEEVTPSTAGTLVRGVCLDDDAQGQPLEVIWELELDAEVLNADAWQAVGKKGFDPPRMFSAYLHALRWNCVTATDPKLFQSPFRAGIRVDAYQLEPLRKALLLPRVNLFIADDVGLGKTIEAGLIASELLLRRRVKDIVVACPPTMLQQWKDELEARFGLTFEILDRAYVERVRRERGYGVNAWQTFPRFLVSHRLLIDESYAAPMREWLDNLRPGSLLILDEAHHAAPSSGARYAIDSRITKAIRDIAPRFEHRLFLSATPHNGHSNSFSALLELLDPQRFTRGVKVVKSNLESVMVRRLKEDIRQIAGGFPERKVVQVDVSDLPADAPELRLSALLDEYRSVRQQRMAAATKRKQAEAAIVISSLQQRLLSSVEAFARTLAVHRRTMERIWVNEKVTVVPCAPDQTELLIGGLDRDDDRSQLPEQELANLEDEAVVAATASTAGEGSRADIARERSLLDQMSAIAEAARGQPDSRVRKLLDWVRTHQCPSACLPGDKPTVSETTWTDTRVLIFTEWEDTRRYLVNMLRAATAHTHLAEHRIEVFHGSTPPERREAVKRAFNLPPAEHPVRILVATDAAREGLNLQAHCSNLFHFDVPWNPSRLEQRNGRIDRKLQPADTVYCHYFVYTQRPEDRVLRALVRKTTRIRAELGSLSQVLDDRLADVLALGIQHDRIAAVEKEIEDVAADPDRQTATEEELESVRERREQLVKQIDHLRGRINAARDWIGLDEEKLKDALSCSLEIMGAQPLVADDTLKGEPARFVFPNLDTRRGADSSWSVTLDTLRTPPQDSPRDWQWRKESPIRPVVFTAPQGIDEEVVQLHLEHRVVQRLLGRFLSQGFVHHDLSRACLSQSQDAIPRVVLLGRLSLYGPGAVRLHEEVLAVSARWTELSARKGPLQPFAQRAEEKSLELLEKAMSGTATVPEPVAKKLQAAIATDIVQLLPHLQTRAEEARVEAVSKLAERGQIEADSLRKILEDQRKRVQAELGRSDTQQLTFEFSEEERRQYDSNRKYWQRWLENVDGDLKREPSRIKDSYEVSTHRIEPVGMAYLWPVTG